MYSNKNNLEVLFEDNHLVIVNKKSGDIVQGDKTGDKPLSDVVKEYIKEKYNKPGDVFLGVVHRLDRPTSGIIIFARTSKALERLNKMLRDRVISKTYWAVIKNNPKKPTDTLIHFLKKNPKNNKSTVFKKEAQGNKKAILHYTTLKNLENYSLLEIDLEIMFFIFSSKISFFFGTGFRTNKELCSWFLIFSLYVPTKPPTVLKLYWSLLLDFEE